ncbi:MAG: hypothetical protein JNK70_14935, partial [Phycisphaerae bacterium]|nr:hypothetical protein [Phycisphaerae bacterium]
IIEQANAFAFELEAAARHAEVAGAYVRMAGTLAEPGQTVVLAQAAFAYHDAALNIARAVLGQPDRHDATGMLAVVRA